MVDPSDVDLEDLIEGSGTSADELDVNSKRELAEKVVSLGSVSLDDQGRMLISCSGGSPALARASYICGIFPLPDPDGDGFKQVCTGPSMCLDDGEVTGGREVFSDCPYNPARLDSDSGDKGDDDSSGLFG